MQKISLSDAAKILGISTNGMRARVKKNPNKYGLSTDNKGKLWISDIPHNDIRLKPSLKSSMKASNIAILEEKIKGLQAVNEEMHEHLKTIQQDRDFWRNKALRPWWKKILNIL